MGNAATQFFAGIAIGILLGSTLANKAGADALDKAQRIQEQYRDCVVVGEFPTKADME